MSYIINTSQSLCQLFNLAAGAAPHRLAGYAVHADLWLGELRRCFVLLDGYESRYELTKRVEAEFPGVREGEEATQKLDMLKIRSVRRDLESAAERFFEACAENGLLEEVHFQTIDELLDLALYESPRNIAYFEMVHGWRG